MKRHRSTRSILALSTLALAGALLGLAPGCLDFEPVERAPGAATSASASALPGSASPDAGDAAAEASAPSPLVSACTACLSGSSCAAAYTACRELPACDTFFVCSADRGCFDPAADKIACLTQCGEAAGLTSDADPAVGAFMKLDACVAAGCAAACTPARR